MGGLTPSERRDRVIEAYAGSAPVHDLTGAQGASRVRRCHHDPASRMRRLGGDRLPDDADGVFAGLPGQGREAEQHRCGGGLVQGAVQQVLRHGMVEHHDWAVQCGVRG